MNLRQSVTEILVPIHEDQNETHRSTHMRRNEKSIIWPEINENSECTEGLGETKDTQRCTQNLFKYKTYSKGLYVTSDDNILYKNMWQQQATCLPCKGDKNNYGYEKLIKETMEPKSCIHKYQKLHKLAMEPSLSITNSQGSKVRYYTI